MMDNAGIGGEGDWGEKITINGGVVTATGGENGAGIGGGNNGYGNYITINGGIITATGGEQGAGIGGGFGAPGGEITINNGVVNATGGEQGAGIGGGNNGYCENIIINGGNVTAIGDEHGAGIGGGGGVYQNGRISLSWTKLSDDITATSYSGHVALERDFFIGTTIFSGPVYDSDNLANKTLTPAGVVMYLDENGVKQKLAPYSFTKMTEKTFDLKSGWYTVTENITISQRIKCSGDVHLILCDDAELIARSGISVNISEPEISTSLFIYGQSKGTGALTINYQNAYHEMERVTADMITTVPSDMNSGLDAYGLAYAGSTIVYLSKTSMRHYYTITDQTKFNAVKDSITFAGEKVAPVSKDGKIYFEKTDIAAADLDTSYTLTIGTNEYHYAVLDYVRDCINATNAPAATKLLVCATYWYNQAANDYFGR